MLELEFSPYLCGRQYPKIEMTYVHARYRQSSGKKVFTDPVPI